MTARHVRPAALALAVLLLCVTPCMGQSIALAPVVGIDLPEEENAQLRPGAMVVWSERPVGAAVKATVPVLEGVSGVALSAGPTIRLVRDYDVVAFAIPTIGVVREFVSSGVDAAYAPSVGVLLHLTEERGGIVFGLKRTFEGSTEVGGASYTLDPYTTAVAGFSLTF